ncbi:Vlp protein, delta subfamily (plasmid) [Borrelia crocidurae str. Achema]|uniref:Variable large protein n=2 Tax=Borrelia crocidurae TaxID=29520 RepID=I0FF77_BORCA|nr:Vlp protein, delta subfamily [Borrelia crocidurae str. Achema]
MVMGCNSGGVKDPEKVFLSDIANLGKGFLDVFVSFGDMITGTLGIKADTKKSEIGTYFSKIAETMESVKNKLQTEVAKNGEYEKVKTVVDEFVTGILDRIAIGAKEAAKGATTDAAIGSAKQNEDAVPGDTASVISLVKGIKEIVGVVLKDNEGNAGATKTGDTEKKSIGKLFAKKDDDRAQEAEAAAANASIGSVSGADILKAIAKSKEDPKVNDAEGIVKATDAAEIAVAPAKDDKKEISEESAKKDAIIAAGIALRAMAKNGKFTAKNNEEKSAHAVNGAAASAVGKTLSTLIIAIRNTVDSGLKKINEVLGTIKQEDRIAEVVTSGQ